MISDYSKKDNKDNISSVKSSDIKPLNEKDLRCAPTKNFENGSCIPLNILVEMAKVYNEEYEDKIKLDTTLEVLNPPDYKKYLIKQFRNRLDKVCDNQKCWVKQKFINRLNNEIQNELKYNTFRPEGPKDRTAWLDTKNINQVLGQYQQQYKDFKFLGAVPVDFDDLPQYGIKDLNFSDLMGKGITKIGIVYNLDEHYKSGSHWTAGFADLNKGTVYYFDSYGIPPEERILKLMRRISNYIKKKLNKEPDVKINKNRHQYKGWDCGVYSISFITRMLRDGDFEKISKNIVKDDEINVCRNVYFT